MLLLGTCDSLKVTFTRGGRGPQKPRSSLMDGVSKGNPGTAGARGLILSLDRSSETGFNLGLGTISNNHTESYSLLKACQIAKELGYKIIQIFWDTELLIKLLNSEDHFRNPTLNKNSIMNPKHLKYFDRVDSYHILRDLNKQADSLTNKGCLMPQGNLSLNGGPCSLHPLA